MCPLCIYCIHCRHNLCPLCVNLLCVCCTTKSYCIVALCATKHYAVLYPSVWAVEDKTPVTIHWASASQVQVFIRSIQCIMLSSALAVLQDTSFYQTSMWAVPSRYRQLRCYNRVLQCWDDRYSYDATIARSPMQGKPLVLCDPAVLSWWAGKYNKPEI